MDHMDSKPRLSDLAEEEILQRIRSGELPAGSRLPSEPELAQQMGISRGILREALNSLQTRGYITRTPRGGSHISNPEASALSKNLMRGFMRATLAELINFREALETHAAMIVIRTASDEEIAHLRELTDYGAWREVTDAHVFHYRLMEMSGIPQYAHFIDFYFERFKSLADPALLQRRPRFISNDIERILQALEKRNAHTARTTLERHFKHIRQIHHLA